MKLVLSITLLCTPLANAQECTRASAIRPHIQAARTTQAIAVAAVAGPTRKAHASGTIDTQLFGAMAAAGVNPAPLAGDAEYLRRATLDLTGRLPTRARVVSFLADTRADKRECLVDELLASPEWVDKWTMYFGDLFKNSVNFGRQRYPQEREALVKWTRAALSANKPYDQMARELITAKGENSWEDPGVAFLSWAGLMIQLEQDRIDLNTVQVSDVFLGLSHMDCLLCHNGRGHLDDISLWGRQTTRRQAWGLAAFFSQTSMGLVNAGAGGAATGPRPGPWYLREAPERAGYALNTTAGDRPARAGGATVTPTYPFSDRSPAQGDNYREFLAKEVTGDLQFARAAVNYVWKEFFVLGIVEPANQLDPARLDPDDPPPAPWTLQPTNARLLNELARDFTSAKFDLKALMRQIATSEAYQLSAAYPGEWKPEMEPLFARKYVRRLWAEEIHDAIAQSSGVASTVVAMQLPGGGVAGGPGGNPGAAAPADQVTAFLDSFLRGNRVDLLRSGEFNTEQALRLMNNPFVLDRIQVSAARLSLSDPQLVDELFLAVLSRPASADERTKALAMLATGDRAGQASNLLWTLYNKVDFVYNY